MYDLPASLNRSQVAVSVDPNHGEALNNIAVLEMRRQKIDLARSCLSSSVDVGSHLFEPMYNSALIAYRLGDFQEASIFTNRAQALHPGHYESKELNNILQKAFYSEW